MRFASLALVLAVSASAQVTAPLLGWLPAGTQIRPMNGLSAAATLGRVTSVGHELAHTAVSPSQNYVLASDARTGEVLLVIPGVSATRLNTAVHPDKIVVSPRGSSAALWFSGADVFEILTGLPGTPAIRQVDASLIHPAAAIAVMPSAIAVSDDGQWLAVASSAGVYQWGPDGVPVQLYNGSDAAALAFFAGGSELVIASSTQLLSIAGSATSVLYQGSFSPAGVATSFDNRQIVLADRSGSIYSINSSNHTPSIADCQCQPTGVFGLGGAIFRLTGSSMDAIKLFDASAGTILAVPGEGRKIARRAVTPAQSTAPLPGFTIHLTPTPTGYLQQPALTITASSAYPTEIDGNVTLYFASSTITAGYSSTDGAIQFATGGTAVNFTIPAGSTQANFSGAPSVTFSTGTTAGTITLNANITAPIAATVVATQTVTNKATWPVITQVQLQHASGGVTVVVSGFSSTDDMISATFQFALSSNATLTQNDLTVNVSSLFQTYFTTPSSFTTGGAFTLTVPFTVTGNPADMVGVTVTMINGVASSNPVSSQ